MSDFDILYSFIVRCGKDTMCNSGSRTTNFRIFDWIREVSATSNGKGIRRIHVYLNGKTMVWREEDKKLVMPFSRLVKKAKRAKFLRVIIQ